MRRALFWVLILGSCLSADSIEYNSLPQNAGNGSEIIWRVDVPPLVKISIADEGLQYQGWNQTIVDGGFKVPVKSKLIYTRSGPPQVNYDIAGNQRTYSASSQATIVERAKGLELSTSSLPNSGSEVIQLKLLRDEGDHQLWALNVLGAVYSESHGEWHIPEFITIQITSDIISQPVVNSEALYLNNYEPHNVGTLTQHATGLGEGKVKLQVLKDGIYRIYYDSLATIPDFPDEQIPSRSLTLRERGEEQAIHVNDHGDDTFNTGDYFDFIGKQKYFDGESQYYDAFSDINVYWLDWGGENGLRFVEESGALVDLSPVRPTTFWDVVHIEEDNDFERLGQVDTDMPSITRDHYFWESVNSGVTEEVQYFLADPYRGSSENIQVSLGLHGLTYSETAGEDKSHTLYAFMNDHSIGSGSWVQQEEYVLTSPSALNLSHNILSANGDNTLAIFAPVSTEPGNYDKIAFNWIEIGYEHLLRAHEDQLRFRKSFINPSTNLEYEIQGFASHELVLYKEGLSKITGFAIRENWDSQAPQYSMVFQDHSTDATPDYWAASLDGLLKPVKAVVDTQAFLRNQDADLIVITIPQLMGELEPYLAFKQEEGWNPIAVSIADIYDEFNYGIHSPIAIKDFLKYANNNWASHPEYVVLFGDAISNPQLTKRDTRIRNIPTFYMQTYGWGAAEADFWYSLINGEDYIPDLHIGRIPVNDREDLITSITKLISYGSGENYGAWQNELITIAGFDAVFKTQSQLLLQNTIPPAYMPSRIFIDRDSEGQVFWGDTDSLVEHWNRGKLFINFLGHGGGAVWADRSLFVRDDINYLNDNAPPAFVTSMTCFTASFAQTRGLGEVVLTESPTGAIGWFGSSGVGWVINDYLMLQPLMRRLLEDDKPVGEIIDIARMEYFLANSGYDYLKPSMLFQYNYLGDPTTRLLKPEKADMLRSQKSIYQPTEQISLDYIGGESGEITLLPIDASNQPWWSHPQTFPATSGSNFIVSQHQSPPAGSSRTIFTLDKGEFESSVQGYSSYSISTDWFEHEPPTAEELSQSPEIPIRVRYHATTAQVDSMVLLLSGANNSQISLAQNGEWWELSDTTRLMAGSGNTYYSFYAFESGVQIQTSPTYTLYLPRDISLSIRDIRPGVKESICGIYIEYSFAGKPSESANLQFEADLSAGPYSVTKEIQVYVGFNSSFIPLIIGIDTVQVTATLEAQSDLDTRDNSLVKWVGSNYYQILPGIGITFDGQSTDTLQLWSNGGISISAVDTSWLHVRKYTDPIEALPGVTLYQDSTLYLLESPIAEHRFNIRSTRQLFRKDLQIPAWQLVESTPSSSGLSAELPDISNSILVGMGQKDDYTGPEVSMMVEGQLFFDGDYMLESSYLNLLGEDQNGFSWDKSSVRVKVNGSIVEAQLGDTTASAQLLSATIPLELEVGEHTISYQMSDALGNWSDEVEVTSIVAGGAAIHDYGNFPNPFEGETLIIYELTQPLEDVVIEIFTLSGYKLHTIDMFNARVSIGLGAIGYHEVPWNGRDHSDDFVANGVYFYRIKGHAGETVIVGPVGKMVKNR